MKANRRAIPKLCWKVHTPGLLREILQGSGQPIYKIPMQIMAGLLGQVAKRASELNDPALNALMVRLTLYEIADPNSRDYNPKLCKQILETGKQHLG